MLVTISEPLLTSIIGYLGLIEDRQYHSEEELLKYTHTAYVKSKANEIFSRRSFRIHKSKTA